MNKTDSNFFAFYYDVENPQNIMSCHKHTVHNSNSCNSLPKLLCHKRSLEYLNLLCMFICVAQWMILKQEEEGFHSHFDVSSLPAPFYIDPMTSVKKCILLFFFPLIFKLVILSHQSQPFSYIHCCNRLIMWAQQGGEFYFWLFL